MELNAEQIIKALERCLTLEYGVACKGCPLSYNDERRTDCLETLMKSAFTLIKKLTAENEAISERYAIQVVKAIKLDKQVQSLTEEYESMAKTVNEASDLIRKLRADKEALTEENERLRTDKDYWKKRAKESESEYDQAVKRGYNIGTVDSVRAFSERSKAETITIQDHTGKLGSVVLVDTIDQIAKEMLEGVT